MFQERPSLYRERASRTYSSLIYASTLVLVEVPFFLFNTVTFTYLPTTLFLLHCSWTFKACRSSYSDSSSSRIPVYFISGLEYDAGTFWIFFAIYLLGNLLSISVIHVICLSAPNLTLANALSALVFTLYTNFAGFLITRDNIPGWWIWAHYMDIDMYGIEALLINEVVPTSSSPPVLSDFSPHIQTNTQQQDKSFYCSTNELVRVPIASTPGAFLTHCPITTGDQLLESLGMHSDNLLRDSLVMLGWWIALLAATTILLKFVVHQKRWKWWNLLSHFFFETIFIFFLFLKKPTITSSWILHPQGG